MPVTIVLATIACIVAVYTDVRYRRIPNWLTGSLAVAAVAVHAIAGFAPLGSTLLVMGVVAIGGIAAYTMRAFGGGDVKFAIAASGMLGFPLCVPFFLYSAIGGGLMAIAFIVLRSSPKESYERVVMMSTGVPPVLAGDKRNTMPYALAFAFGIAIVALSQSVAPFLRISL